MKSKTHCTQRATTSHQLQRFVRIGVEAADSPLSSSATFSSLEGSAAAATDAGSAFHHGLWFSNAVFFKKSASQSHAIYGADSSRRRQTNSTRRDTQSIYTT